ncbi:MAG: M23 family metallopeptidase [Kofleriaceae bacterium]
MSNLATTRILLLQPAQTAHAGSAKPWLWPLPRLDGAAPCVLSPGLPARADGLAQLGYREGISSSELVPVFAPHDGAITYAARADDGGMLCLDHPGGWSTSYGGLHTVLARSRDRCSGRRRPRVRSGDVIGYLRGPLCLGFAFSRWEDGAWTTVDLVESLGAWSFQPWFTALASGAGSAVAI